MKKIAKLLGRHWLSVLAIVILLFVQALSELSLPNYTSNIINVGIQQGGVEDAAALKLRESEMQKLMFFMTDSERENVMSSYTLRDDVYELNDITDERREQLSDELAIPMTIAYASANMTEQSDVSFDTAGMMNEDGTLNIEFIRAQMEQLDDAIIKQLAINYVKSEYDAIGIDTAALQNDYMLRCGLYMILYALAAMVASVLITFFAAKIAAAFGRDIRLELFGKVMTFSNAEFDNFSTASIITRCTNDVQQVQMFTVMMLRMVLYAPIIGIGALMNVVGSEMTWVIALAVSVLLTLIIVLMIIGMPKFKVVQKLIDNLNRVSREILTGLPVIRAFSREKHEEKRFDDANRDITKLNLFLNRLMSVMMPSMMFIMNGVSVLIIWVGAKNVDLGRMQVGDLTAFIAYTMQIIMAFLMLSMMSIMMPRAIVSFKRIGEIFNTKALITDPEKPERFDEQKKGYVEFKNVSFRYGGADEDVLHDISFVSAPGQTTAIIGSTGSGKSTIANLIPRFFDATEGEVLVGGRNVRDVKLSELRDKIGYVSQKAVLFKGTIKSNIAYSDENMAQEQVEKAAEIAQALDFIQEKEDGFDDPISQGGTNVSGGQKQRLSIARAIAKKPEIYIFDDSFSALDYKTDISLRRALNEYTSGSTVIIVAQRISTVLNADQILVLDEGRIVGAGTHKELMTTCDVYRQIALSQLSEQELGSKEGA